MNGRILFVTGGARSGKSSFAMREAEKIPGSRTYIATAEALDQEMRERIEAHRKERAGGWKTIEEPAMLDKALKFAAAEPGVVLIDCLTLWLSNIMQRGSDVPSEIRLLTETLRERTHLHRDASLFIVSNEVGLGIVPANEMARTFRDFAGSLNQAVASVSDEVWFMVSGIPMKIKG